MAQPSTMNREKPKFEIIPGAGKNMNFKEEVCILLQKEPFFAALSRTIPKKENYNIPTALVKIDKKTLRFEMQYNPDFMGTLTPTQRLGVLKHEFYHLIFEHLTTRFHDWETQPKLMYTWNIATDLAINSFIKDELPDFVCVPGGPYFEDYPPFLTAEAYFARLNQDEEFQERLKKKEQNGDFRQKGAPGGSGEQGQPQPGQSFEDEHGQFDVHDWEEVSEQDKAVAHKHLDRALREAKDEAMFKGWGSISSSVKRHIEEMLSSNVPWQWLLESIFRRSRRGKKRGTYKRINRRLPYKLPGRSVKRELKVFVACDESGSVSDGLMAAFIGEMNGFAKFGEFDFGPFDTQLDPKTVFTWKQGELRYPEREWCGGTNFNAPTEYCNKEDYDLLIILTDMMAPKPIPSKCPRVWITKEVYKNRMPFQTDEVILTIDE